MRTIDDITYFTIGEIAKRIGRSVQTIKNWYDWREQHPESSSSLPDFRTDITARGTRFFAERDIPLLESFRDNVQYGKMSDVNVTKWGQRGVEIMQRKEEKNDDSMVEGN